VGLKPNILDPGIFAAIFLIPASAWSLSFAKLCSSICKPHMHNCFGLAKFILSRDALSVPVPCCHASRKKNRPGCNLEYGGKDPGIKNIWLKTQRNQIRDFDGVYAIEFASPEAAARLCREPAARNLAQNRWESYEKTRLSCPDVESGRLVR